MERDVSVLEEQKLGLQVALDLVKEALKRQEASALVMQEEHRDRLNQQESTFNARLQSEQERSMRLSDDIERSRVRLSSSEERNKVFEDEIQDLRQQLQAAHLPSPEMEAQLRALRSRVTTLEAAEMKSTLRAKTIDARYRIGDLVRAQHTRFWLGNVTQNCLE